MTARKRKKSKTTCYIINYISYDQTDVEKFIETPIAKLKSNLIGTQFVLYDFGIKPSKINESKHLLNTLSNNNEPVENQECNNNINNNTNYLNNNSNHIHKGKYWQCFHNYTEFISIVNPFSSHD